MRHCNWIRNVPLFVVLKFVIIDRRLRKFFLLLFLEPAEAKEENVWSFSIVHTNNIGLENEKMRIHKCNGIAENKRMWLVREEH
jgi:hypothetical protein